MENGIRNPSTTIRREETSPLLKSSGSVKALATLCPKQSCICGISSFGRATDFQSVGGEFEPRIPLRSTFLYLTFWYILKARLKMARKGKRYHFLYKTTNLLNGKFYVGMHSTYDMDDGYLGSGLKLRRSIRKYGIENFKIEYLEFFENRELLALREKNLVNESLLKDPLCMNLKLGGNGGFTKENSLKGTLAMSKIIWNDPAYRERHKQRKSKLMKELNSAGKIKYDTFTGKSHSEETKKLMSAKAQQRVGDKNSQFGTCWIFNGKENKKIKIEELPNYLCLGWIKGRKMRV